MSMGTGAYADKILEDEKTVIYEYGSYNLNDPHFRNAERKCDGSIIISKQGFDRQETNHKVKRTKGGKGRKKSNGNRIPRDIDCQKMIDEGLAEIKNCGNCWQTTNDEKKIDIMALHILFYLLVKYGDTGEFPPHIGYDV